MKKVICGLGGFFLYAVLLSAFVSGTFGDPMEICQPRNVSYKIADSKQCDMYHECTKGGKLLERLCDDGFVFSIEIHACDYPHNVNCTARPALQPSRSTHPDCPRSNGFYAFPPAESCQKFHHCLEGKAYEKTCPEGVIFDVTVGTCMHPDLSKRPDCAAKSVLNFTCPNYGKKFGRLRFGDHDRLPHPTNCRKFFICLADGKPRVGGCPLGKIFNPKLGFCEAPSKRVPECKDYYGKKDLAKLAKLAELGEEGALEDDQIESVDDEEEEDPSANETLAQDQEPAGPQPQPQPQPQQEAPRPKSKGKKFQSQLTINKRAEGQSSPSSSNQADDNSSPSQKTAPKNKSEDKNEKTDDEGEDDD